MSKEKFNASALLPPGSNLRIAKIALFLHKLEVFFFATPNFQLMLDIN